MCLVFRKESIREVQKQPFSVLKSNKRTFILVLAPRIEINPVQNTKAGPLAVLWAWTEPHYK